MTGSVSLARRAAFAGGFCVAVLGASLVLHAWPLRTGRPMLLRVMPIDPRDPFRGEYVWLAFAEERLVFADTPSARSGNRSAAVRPLGAWASSTRPMLQLRDTAAFVQLETQQTGPLVVARAVSVSDRPVPGAVNLRGLVRYWDGSEGLSIDYGIDAFYVQEGRAMNIQREFRADNPVYAEVMVASNGRARLRRLLRADGSVIAD